MASRKCTRCGKPAGRLYGGICNSCKTLEAYEKKKKAMESQQDSEFNNSDEQAFSGFTRLMVNDIDASKAEESDYNNYLKMSPDDKRKWEFNRICELNYIDKGTQLKYRPQLLQIIKKYRGLLLDEDVYLCTKEDYTKTPTGEVCDIIGNFVIRRFVDTKDEGIEIQPSVLLSPDELVDILESGYETEE